MKKLENWNVIKRLDATDYKKHMGLILMIPKFKEETMQLVFDIDYIEGYTDNDATLLYQGLTMNLTKHYRRIVFLYIRKTPSRKETNDIKKRLSKFDCIIGDLNLNPAIKDQKEKLKMICGENKYLALEEITTANYNQLDHIILEKDLSNISYCTAFNNFSSDHKSIVLRLATKKTSFLEEFQGKMYFNVDKHLKETKKCQSEYEVEKMTQDELMNNAFLDKTEITEEEIDNVCQANIQSFNTRASGKTDDEELQENQDHDILQLHGKELENKDLILIRFINPPMRNLCFSNVIVTCLLNIPILRKYLQEARSDTKEKKSINTELCQLSNISMNNKPKSTQLLRRIVTIKCSESGEISRIFDNDMQCDCVEFLQSLFEHFWKEQSIPSTLNESVFGGLFQESFLCECGKKETKFIQRLPDVISVPIKGETVQNCLDCYLSSEQIEKKCQFCPSLKSFKSIDIIVPPSTLIIHLNRFTYDEKTKTTKKLHVPVSSPLALSFKNEKMYGLNAVINHIGESSSSGHYNIMLVDKLTRRFILVDDLEISCNPVIDNLNRISYVVVYTRQ